MDNPIRLRTETTRCAVIPLTFLYESRMGYGIIQFEGGMCNLHFIGIDDDRSACRKSESEASLFKSFHHALTDVVNPMMYHR